MAAPARTADAAIGSEEEEEMERNFRTERDQMGEGLDILGVAKTVSRL